MANSFLYDSSVIFVWEKTLLKAFLWKPFVDCVEEEYLRRQRCQAELLVGQPAGRVIP